MSDRFIWTRIASAAAAAVALAGTLGLVGTTPPAAGQAFGLPELSPESRACADCHKKDNIGLYQQWGASKHYRGNVGCYECHAARPGEPHAKFRFDHAVMERLLADGRFCRFPTRVVFDAAGLEPGELAAAEQVGDHPRDGYVIRVHPRFESRALLLPLIVAYQLVVVNYGEIATREEAEIFGATLLGLPIDDYYETLCLAADSLAKPAP